MKWLDGGRDRDGDLRERRKRKREEAKQGGESRKERRDESRQGGRRVLHGNCYTAQTPSITLTPKR